MKSSSEPTQSQKPLDGKTSPTGRDQSEIWRPYGPNPLMEINNLGQLRTKPINPNAADPWGMVGKRG